MRSGFLKKREEPDPLPGSVSSLWWYEPACCLLMEQRERYPEETGVPKKVSKKLFWIQEGVLSVFVLWILGFRREGMNTNSRAGQRYGNMDVKTLKLM